MSIIRSPRKETNFYILDKNISEDKRLSWGARGLLIYLLGKPDHWKVSVEALRNETAESGKPTGRDGVYAFLSELIDAGYVTREMLQSNGRMAGYNYYVMELPFTENQETAPCTETPYTGEPYTANTTLVRNDSSNNCNSVSIEFAPVDESPVDAMKDLNATTWKAYSDAFFDRYKTEPVRNAKVNGQIAQLTKRIGKEAPAVAAYYLTHNKRWYVEHSHSVDSLLKDAEGLRTQWATNKQVTESNARSADRLGSSFKMFEDLDMETPF